MSNLYCERGSDKQLPEWVPCLCNSSFPCKYKIRVTQQKPVAQVFPLWPQWRWPGNCPYMAPFMTHTVSLRHILLKTSSLSPTEIYSTILSYCVFGDGDIYFYFFFMPRLSDPSDSNTSRCFSLSLQSSVKWSQDRINDGCWFHPGLNEMSWDAHSLEETGWATQALFLNGKIAEGGKKKQAEQQTHTHTRQAVTSKAAPTDTHGLSLLMQ